MSGYSYSSDSQIDNPEVEYSTLWHGIVHSPLDINTLEDIPHSHMYITPIHDTDSFHTWTWEVWFEWEYPRPHPITVTGQWETCYEVN